MRRDMELVRRILLTVESRTAAENDGAFTLPDVPNEVAWGHLEIMQEAGLIEATLVGHSGPGIIMASVSRLTWAGHDFLEAVRSETIWAKTKAKLAATGVAWTFEAVKSVAVTIGKQPLESYDAAQ